MEVCTTTYDKITQYTRLTEGDKLKILRKEAWTPFRLFRTRQRVYISVSWISLLATPMNVEKSKWSPTVDESLFLM